MSKKNQTIPTIETKLTTDELTEFKQNHTAYQQAIVDLGILEININETEHNLDSLNDEKHTLLSHIKALTTQKQEISAKLGDKYGNKQVDLETGNLF
jgi:chromosome segregation ATPase